MSIKDLLVKFNDLSTSLQDIIMRKITWDMLSTSMKDWLKDKEERINSLEDWRDSGVVEKAIDDFKIRLTILEAGEKMDFTDCTQGQFAKFDLKNRCFYDKVHSNPHKIVKLSYLKTSLIVVLLYINIKL